MKTKTIEGVTYYPFRWTFKLASGKKVRWTRWAPYQQAAYESFYREIQSRFELSELKPGSAYVKPLFI